MTTAATHRFSVRIPRSAARSSTRTLSTHTVCKADELPEGARRIIEVDGEKIGVFNCGGELLAIEDRCSHDDGPLAEGEFDPATCTVECPRHGSLFDLRSGKPKTLPAYVPVDTYEIRVEDGEIKLEVD